MTLATSETRSMSLRRAFEAEHARRDAVRHAREEAERKQQEEDLARAQQLYDALAEDEGFLREKGLTLGLRRYTVTLQLSTAGPVSADTHLIVQGGGWK